jgi:galactokinase
MMLDCRSLDYKNAPLPDDARLLIVNSGVKHRLQAGGYNNRRDECEQAVTDSETADWKSQHYAT